MTNVLPAKRQYIADSDLTVSKAAFAKEADAIADATRRAYQSDMRAFAEWAAPLRRKTVPATAETVYEYLSAMEDAGLKASTISRRLAAISSVHQALGEEPPTRHYRVRKLHKAIRNRIGVRPERKSPVSSEDLRAHFAGLNHNPTKAARDRALLAVGFALAARRSELVALDVEHFSETPEGYAVLIARSKTDPSGAGFEKALAYGQDSATCPIILLRRWLEVAGISSGPVFRAVDKAGTVGESRLSSQAVANVVKAAATALGKDPAAFSGHSLRRGMISEAARNGASERSIQRQTGHRSTEVLRGYIETATVHEDNAVNSLGL